MKGQMSFFSEPPLRIRNTVRLIELFGGIGAQAKAFERLGVDFERYRLCEIDKHAVASYNAVHGTDFTTGDITQLHAEDLGIVDRDKYTYVLCYSFPCQDLSLAGKRKGMSRDSGTRSGLLWEVERLLKECGDDLPQILLMENVEQVVAEKNIRDFNNWKDSLREMGYTNKWKVMNAKDYGVPQSRSRCFMLSWLGDYDYEFPEPIILKKRLKDVLEDHVEDRYYLTDEQVASFVWRQDYMKAKGFGFGSFSPRDPDEDYACTLKTQYRDAEDNYVIEKETGPISQGSWYTKNGKTFQWMQSYDTNGTSPTLLARDYKSPPGVCGDD